jgi:hypothetical protein
LEISDQIIFVDLMGAPSLPEGTPIWQMRR